LTPRLGPVDLSSGLGSATGRTGAYPDGTFTREKNASFRTHHVHFIPSGEPPTAEAERLYAASIALLP
jgi:hypothetical protein